MKTATLLSFVLSFLLLAPALCVQASWAGTVVVKGETVYTMAGEPIENGVVVVTDGKISAIGAASEVEVPADVEVLEAKVVTPV